MLKLCRICGNPGQLDIYSQWNENSTRLADKINSFLTLQVSPEDQLSLRICQTCTNQIEDVYPIFEFCCNTTKLMSMIIGNIPLDNLRESVESNVESFEAVETFQEDINSFEMNAIKIQENNKENESDNLNADARDINIVMIQKPDQNTSQCLRCTDIFTSGTSLRRHILLNHNLKDLDCHHCFRRCSNEFEFENHVKLHFVSEYPYYPCDLCFNSFNSLVNLVHHIKTHVETRTNEWALSYNQLDGSTRFGCRHCNRTFILEASRRIHERIHFSSFICEMCGKRLPNKSQLNVHQRQHTGERPYECSNCGSSFKCLSTLRQHEVIHSEKKYNCEVCLRKFSRPEKVRIHMRVHTGEKPYNCLMCPKKYQQKNDLNRHIKKKHGESYTMDNLR